MIRAAIFLGVICCVGVGCAQPKAGSWSPNNASETDRLINELASRYPPANPNLDILPRNSVDPDSPAGRDVDRVQRAMEQLEAMGLSAFPALVAGSKDTRYSFSRTEACWVNYDVGYACYEIIARQVEGYPGTAPEGFKGQPEYISHVWQGEGLKAWWARNSHKSLEELQVEAINWEIAEDRANLNDGRHRDWYTRDLASRQLILKGLVGNNEVP